MKITILGHGVFGGAVATHLSRLGHEIEVDKIDGSELIFVCTPSFAVVPVLLKNKDKITNQKIIICSKGFSEDGRLLSEVLKDDFADKDIFFFYGPTIAEEIVAEVFSGVVLAGGEGREEIKKQIESENLIVETTDDIIGVQVGAAMKNVITIFVGVVEGAKYGQNTKGYILTKGLQEIQKLGVALGADANTFMGLSCIGDITLRSRNRTLGVELGKGRKLGDILTEMHYTQEGIASIKNARIIGKRIGMDVPFIDTLHDIIFEELEIDKAIRRIR